MPSNISSMISERERKRKEEDERFKREKEEQKIEHDRIEAERIREIMESSEDAEEITEEENKVKELKKKEHEVEEEVKEEKKVEKETEKLHKEEREVEQQKKAGPGKLKRFGVGMAGGAKSMGSGVVQGAGMMDNLAFKKIKQPHQKIIGSAPAKLIILLVVALVIHIIDAALLGFNRVAALSMALGLYVSLFILSVVFFYNKEEGFNLRQILTFVGLGAFYILVPAFLYMLPTISIIGPLSLLDVATDILTLFPLWVIYVGIQANIPFFRNYFKIWIIILLVILFLVIGLQLNVSSLAQIGGKSVELPIGTAFNYLVQQGVQGVNNLWKSLSLVPAAKQLLNSSGLDYYTGMVDNNQKAPVGLYLTNVRTMDQYFYSGSPITMWADISGKSFMEEIRVVPHCFIEDKYSGTSDPSSFTILGEEHDTLSCTFDSLPKGSYLAKLTATFNFETWAYVTYTFVDQEVERAIQIAGKNVNTELDVEQTPRAVYTNGPVMLGMASMVNQPIGIDTKYNTKEPVLGVTLQNVWTDGNIAQSYGFVIQVPDDFTLVKCDRGIPLEELDKEPGYNFYTFTREQLNDSRMQFQSVTCRLHIKNPTALLAGVQKVERTFVAQAKYDYTLEKSVRIYVKE